MKNLRSNLIYLAWVQAFIATLGSLFFSEVMDFVPCDLCWYQRIAMYPLLLLLTVGILLHERAINYYVQPLSLIGLFIALYHNLLYYGIIPEGFHICTMGVPCETRWIQWFGFVGIQFLSFTAFIVIILSMMWHKFADEENLEETDSTMWVRLRQVLSIALIILYLGILTLAASSRQSADITKNTGFPEPNMIFAWRATQDSILV